MNLICYLLKGSKADIHPANRTRAWMDGTPEVFAYRCLPLTIANSHGWEIRCGEAFEAEWSGGDQAEDIDIYPDESGNSSVESGFGSGILSFAPRVVFRTPPGYNMWITGPTNHFKDGIQPLTAVVETDWIPFPFSMNWKFTRPGLRIRFEKNEPICFLFPIERGLIERFEPRIMNIEHDSVLKKQYTTAHYRRQFFNAVKQVKGQAVKSLRHQGWYMKGELPDGSSRVENHQKFLDVKSFLQTYNLEDEKNVNSP